MTRSGCSRDRQVSLMHFPAIVNAFIISVFVFQHYTKAVSLSAPQRHMQMNTGHLDDSTTFQAPVSSYLPSVK